MEEKVVFDFWELEEKIEYCEFLTSVFNQCYLIENMLNTNLFINVIFTTPEKIREINNQYRNIDKPTDVLSFPMFEKEELQDLFKRKEIYSLGDIIISIEQVETQAKEYGHSFERELAYMAVHGFYHLMGYDHIEEDDKIEMRKKEEEVLQSLKINR